MTSLFASETATEAAVQSSGFFPPYFGTMILALVIVAGVATILAFLGWRAIDALTPGNLNYQLLGDQPPPGTPHDPSKRPPNVALAIVVGAMFLGISFIMGCTIVGVLMH